jgi:hypothetical protein
MHVGRQGRRVGSPQLVRRAGTCGPIAALRVLCRAEETHAPTVGHDAFIMTKTFRLGAREVAPPRTTPEKKRRDGLNKRLRYSRVGSRPDLPARRHRSDRGECVSAFCCIRQGKHALIKVCRRLPGRNSANYIWGRVHSHLWIFYAPTAKTNGFPTPAAGTLNA